MKDLKMYYLQRSSVVLYMSKSHKTKSYKSHKYISLMHLAACHTERQTANQPMINTF